MFIPISLIPPMTIPIYATAVSISVPLSISSYIPVVPFYSQLTDIKSAPWRSVGCGITSLAMIIDYYSSESINVESLLQMGIAGHAYDKNAGWIHQGLINISKNYNLEGESISLANLSDSLALEKLTTYLADGPVMASIHYRFDPKSIIPHLIVIDGIRDNKVYYNDPVAKVGSKTISVTDFEKGWKKKIIVIRPDIDKSTSKNTAEYI